jgi:hypothetical protein
MFMRSLAIIFLIALAAALAAGCSSLPPTVPVVHDAVYPATGLTDIQLENQNGMVNVTGWDLDQVQVRVLEGRRVDNISVEIAGTRMMVKTLPTGVVGLNGPQARYEVSVPRTLQRIEVQTSNGQIPVTDCNATVVAETSNGAIRLSGTRTIERLATSNGAIDAEVRALDADARVSTSNGAIRLRLAPSLNAEIEARTSNGQVTVSGLALNTTTSGQNEVRGTLGAGGPRLVVQTSNGAITLAPL